VTLYPNDGGCSRVEGVSYAARDFPSLLTDATKLLGLSIAGRRVFHQSGIEVASVGRMHNGESYVVSTGDEYRSRSSINRKKKAIKAVSQHGYPSKALALHGSHLSKTHNSSRGSPLSGGIKSFNKRAPPVAGSGGGGYFVRLYLYPNDKGIRAQPTLVSVSNYSELLDAATDNLNLKRPALRAFSTAGLELVAFEEARNGMELVVTSGGDFRQRRAIDGYEAFPLPHPDIADARAEAARELRYLEEDVEIEARDRHMQEMAAFEAEGHQEQHVSQSGAEAEAQLMLEVMETLEQDEEWREWRDGLSEGSKKNAVAVVRFSPGKEGEERTIKAGGGGARGIPLSHELGNQVNHVQSVEGCSLQDSYDDVKVPEMEGRLSTTKSKERAQAALNGLPIEQLYPEGTDEKERYQIDQNLAAISNAEDAAAEAMTAKAASDEAASALDASRLKAEEAALDASRLRAEEAALDAAEASETPGDAEAAALAAENAAARELASLEKASTKADVLSAEADVAKEMASETLQAAVRGTAAREEIENMHVTALDESAAKVQGVVRGKDTRDRMNEMRGKPTNGANKKTDKQVAVDNSPIMPVEARKKDGRMDGWVHPDDWEEKDKKEKDSDYKSTREQLERDYQARRNETGVSTKAMEDHMELEALSPKSKARRVNSGAPLGGKNMSPLHKMVDEDLEEELAELAELNKK